MKEKDADTLRAEICGNIGQAIGILRETRKAVQRMTNTRRLSSYSLLTRQNVEILEQERKLVE